MYSQATLARVPGSLGGPESQEPWLATLVQLMIVTQPRSTQKLSC